LNSSISKIKPVSEEYCSLSILNNRLIFIGGEEQLGKGKLQYKYNKKQGFFEIALTPGVISYIEGLYPNIQCDKTVQNYKNIFYDKFQLFLKYAKTKELDHTDNINIPIIDTKEINLMPHQYFAIHMNTLLSRVLCMDDMGLGKTYAAIYTALIKKQQGCRRCLIVCPNSTKTTVWVKEIEKITDVKYCLPEGGANKREQIILDFMKKNETDINYYFLIINYEIVCKHTNILKQFADYQMLILDEAHYVKTMSAKRSKTIARIRPCYKLGLTGTPLSNRPEDAFGVYEQFLPLIFNKNFGAFRDNFCKTESVTGFTKEGKEVTRKRISGYKNLNFLSSFSYMIGYRRTKTDTLCLPPKQRYEITVDMEYDQEAIYKEVANNLYSEIELIDEGTIVIQARGILSKLIKLSQIADGFVKDAHGQNFWLPNNSKIIELDNLLKHKVESLDNKIVIWCKFTEVFNQLMKRYQKYGATGINGSIKAKDRSGIIDNFQNNKQTKVFIGQINSCACGITLHSASHMVFYDKAMLSTSSISQAEDRCHRIGQFYPCKIYSLTAIDTIDERWNTIWKEKQEAIKAVLDGLDYEENNSEEDSFLDKVSQFLTKEDFLRLTSYERKKVKQ
jgi:SNF2 family DNA or RNA helicase